MNNLPLNLEIDFSKMVNNSFVYQINYDSLLLKNALARGDLPTLARDQLIKDLNNPEKLLFKGVDALKASLGRFDLISCLDKTIIPVNAEYEFDFDNYAFGKIVDSLDIPSANFLMSYLQWRTGERMSSYSWPVVGVCAGIAAIDSVDSMLIVTQLPDHFSDLKIA